MLVATIGDTIVYKLEHRRDKKKEILQHDVKH